MRPSVFLETNHLFLRNPRGGVEGVAEMAAASFGVILCNIGDYPPSDWQVIRDRAKSAGVKCGPWLRTANSSGTFDEARLELLVDTADSWDWAPLVCNSEKEIDHSGSELTSYIANELGDRDAAISMEVRPFGAVDWRPVAKYPILPQNFPAETHIGDTDYAIRENWNAAGCPCVAITYGAYGGMVPDEFARLTPYGVYTGDDCGNDFEQWAPLGNCEPCAHEVPTPPDGGDGVTKIGTQDGVTAAMNRLRDLDPGGTILYRDPKGKWAALDTIEGTPLDKWKAYDKLERSLAILVEDHDQAA